MSRLLLLIWLSPLVAALAGCGSTVSTASSLASISIGPPSATLAKGLTQQFSATGIYSDGSKRILGTVTWSSAAPGVASIGGSSGTATALGVGSTTISATLDGVSGTATVNVTAATLVKFGITPANPSIAAGLNEKFTATGVYSDNSTRNLTSSVTWASSSASVAPISTGAGGGLASATTAGSTTITASLGEESASTQLTVTAAVLASIQVSPASLSVAAGLQHQFQATGIYTDNSKHDLTNSVTWTSSAAKVATISNMAGANGLATTLIPGSSTITATLGALSGSAPLTVTAATLVSLTVTPANPRVVASLSAQLQATGIYTDQSSHDLTAQAIWSSSNTRVATVSNAMGFSGLTMALSPGSVIVTATVGSTTGSTGLTVVAATLASISVTPPGPTIAGGTDQQFTATGIYTDNSTENLTTSAAWTSSAPAVAVISNSAGSNGLAAAVAPGTTTIVAAFGNVSGSATLKVSTTRLVSIAVTPANSSIAVTTSEQLTATGTFSDGSTQDLTAAVTWGVGDPTIVSVSNAPGFSGFATAILAGSTGVTATLGSISASTNLTVTAATLTSIAVTPAAPSCPKGVTQQFAAVGTYSDGSTQDITTSVTWTSSATSIASISNVPGSRGQASCVEAGPTTITAAVGAVSGSTSLTVTSAALVALSVTPSAATLASGGNRQFTATGTYTDNSLQNLTTMVTWMSANSGVASISNAAGSQGLASGVSVGSTMMTASLSMITSAPATITITAAPQFAYAVNTYDGTIWQYTIGAGGALSSMTTPIVAAGASPEAIIVDPSGSYAYVTNSGDGTISQFSVGAMGALIALNPATVPAGDTPQSVGVEPGGHYVYAANTGDGTVSQYVIGGGGSLSPLSPATVNAGSGPDAVTVDPTGHYVYVANEDGTVSQFTIGVGGSLVAMSPPVVAAGGFPQAITVDPTGRFVYVVNSGDNTLSEFAISAGGTLVTLSPSSVATGNFPQSIAVDAGGRYVYVANSSDGTVSQYSIGGGGVLAPLSPAAVTVGNGPQGVTVDLTGHYLYVANEGDDSIAALVIGAGGSLPTTYSVIGTGMGPFAVATAY